VRRRSRSRGAKTVEVIQLNGDVFEKGWVPRMCSEFCTGMASESEDRVHGNCMGRTQKRKATKGRGNLA